MSELGPGVANEKIAMGFAQEIVDATQFVYNTANMPEILRGPVGGLILQFKSFFIKELEFLASLTPKEMAAFGVTMSGIAGAGSLFNIPGVDLIDAGTGLIFDKSLSEALKLSAEDNKSLAGLAAYGLPGALLGVDISDSAGVASITELLEGLIGPTLSDASKFGEFGLQAAADVGSAGFVLPETHRRLWQSFMPSFIRRMQRGIAIAQTGDVRSSYSGKLIYRPDQRYWTAISQFIGAPQIEQTQSFIRDQVVTRVRDRYTSARSSFAKEAALAVKEGNTVKAQQILTQAQANGYTIDQTSLRYYVNEIDRDASDRRARRTPVELRARLEATGVLSPRLP